MNGFQKFKSKRSSIKESYSGIIALSEAFEEQVNLKYMSLLILIKILNQKT